MDEKDQNIPTDFSDGIGINFTTADGRKINRKIKDSVFTDLFGQSKYLLQFYQSLHPEDHITTEADIEVLTIRNILTNGFYNDLGAMIRHQMIFFCEAQSTWSVNILMRTLIYMADTYARYCRKHHIDLFKEKKATLPKPELYVLYTGNRKNKPAKLSLRKDFFKDENCPIDVEITMIYDGKEGDIISQYVEFTKVCNEQIKLHGRSAETVEEILNICKTRHILKEYLDEREEEVRSIMGILTDEEIYRIHDESIREEAEKRGEIRGKRLGEIKGIVQTCQSVGLSKSDAKERVILQFDLPEEEAEQKVVEFWIDK